MTLRRSVSVSAAAALLGLAALAASGTASARSDVAWSVGIGVPGAVVNVGNAYPAAPVYYAPPPVVVQPAPVYYAPRPVYYQPAPAYYQPAPVYVVPGRPWHGHRHHHHHGGGHYRY